MSERFIGGAILALLAAVALFVALIPERPFPSPSGLQNAGYTQYRPGGSRCDPARLGRLEQRQALIERDRCEEAAEEHRLKREDLKQQTRSASASEAIVDLTYSQTVLLAGGVAISFLTLIAAVFAVLYARDAAREAKRGADAADGTANAYIAVERPRLKAAAQRATPLNSLGVIQVVIAAENIGKSSAYVHGIAYGSNPANRWPPPLTTFKRLPKGFAVQGEGGCEIGEIQTAIDGSSGYVVGILVYSSAFEAEHHSYFCIHVRKIGDATSHGEPEQWEAKSFHKAGEWPEDT